MCAASSDDKIREGSEPKITGLLDDTPDERGAYGPPQEGISGASGVVLGERSAGSGGTGPSSVASERGRGENEANRRNQTPIAYMMPVKFIGGIFDGLFLDVVIPPPKYVTFDGQTYARFKSSVVWPGLVEEYCYLLTG